MYDQVTRRFMLGGGGAVFIVIDVFLGWAWSECPHGWLPVLRLLLRSHRLWADPPPWSGFALLQGTTLATMSHDPRHT